MTKTKGKSKKKAIAAIVRKLSQVMFADKISHKNKCPVENCIDQIRLNKFS
jgi:hypothetical protein